MVLDFVCLLDNPKICKRLVKEEGIHSIILCPGCTHRDVAEISEAVGKDVAVSVARGDGPSMHLLTSKTP